MIRKVLALLVFAAILTGCGRDMSTDGALSPSTPTASEAQQLLDRARFTYMLAAVANSTYQGLPKCVTGGHAICKDAALAAAFTKGLDTADAAIATAQGALNLGDNPSTLAKVKFALDAALAALKIAQSYGVG